jgi:RHS repeat-associated protein
MTYSATGTTVHIKLCNNQTTGIQANWSMDNITVQSVDYYAADVVSASDYYPFGSLMPGRNFSSSSYRFGFNGMEMDNEIKSSTGNSYTTYFRQYDPRLGKWMSKDVVNYPWQSPYAAFNNNPIYFADPSGAEGEKKTAREKKRKARKADKALAKKHKDYKKRTPSGDDADFGTGSEADGTFSIYADAKTAVGKILAKIGEAFKGVKNGVLSKLQGRTPKPDKSSNPSHHNKIRPGSNIDNQGNFFMIADSYNALVDASLSGAEVTYVTGGLLDALRNDIHDFNDANIDFYRSLANEFLQSGKSSIIGQRGVTFSPLGNVDALLNSTTAIFVMRNAQVHYSVMMTSDGDIQIAIAAWDFFDVKPTREKVGFIMK